MPHVAPLHPETQPHVFGAVHVPPFAHVGEQTARRSDEGLWVNEPFYGFRNIRLVQVAPVQEAVQVQVFGDEHVPPF